MKFSSVLVMSLLVPTSVFAPAFTSLVVAQETPQPAEVAEPVVWESSVEDVTAKSKQTGKLMLADFYTTWCGYCKMMERGTYLDSRVEVLLGEFVPIRINAERGEGPQLAQLYGVKGYPSIFFLSSDGDPVGKTAFQPPEDFAQTIARTLKEHSLDRLIEETRTRPTDPTPLTSLATIHLVLNDIEKGDEYLRRANALKGTSEAAKANAPRLLRVNLMVASAREADGLFDMAMPHLEKAFALAQTTDDQILTHLRLANGHIATRNRDKAVPLLETVLAVEGLRSDERKIAQELLAKAKS